MTTATKKPKVPVKPKASYDEDYYGWALEQAAFLRAGQTEALDLENLAEEVEDLGKGEYQKLRSALHILLLHMLKWDYQPKHRSRSWAASVRIQRQDILELMSENPSLKPRFDDAFASSYARARLSAVKETDLSLKSFSENCPYTRADLTDRQFPAD